MVGGFTFDGVDIADIGLEYAPEQNNTFVYRPASYKISEQMFEAHDGGYYYGETVQPKEFVLRCIYEDQHILDGVIAKIYSVFRRGKTGRLVFKKRPWCWYTATVTNVDINQMTNYMNGTVTITLKAYYPFARTDYDTIPNNSEYEKDMLNNSGLMASSYSDTSFAPITEDTTILLYNPGTERAKTAIQIAGDVGEGVMIANATTGQNCRFVAISSETVSGNYYVQCDALNGQTIKTDGTVSEPGFIYHDQGFIELEPGYPAYRDIQVTCQQTYVKSNGMFNENMVGRYIYFADNSSAKIVRFEDTDTIVVDKTVTEAQNGKAQILLMNEIRVSSYPAGGSMNLTKLNFIFKPTFA